MILRCLSQCTVHSRHLISASGCYHRHLQVFFSFGMQLPECLLGNRSWPGGHEERLPGVASPWGGLGRAWEGRACREGRHYCLTGVFRHVWPRGPLALPGFTEL